MKKIFILEDNPNRIDSFKAMFREYEIIHTDRPDVALEILKKETELTAILLDHDLGGQGEPYSFGKYGNGDTLTKNLAKEKIHVDTPIIIHSLNWDGVRNMFSHIKDTHKNVKIVKFIEFLDADPFTRRGFLG